LHADAIQHQPGATPAGPFIGPLGLSLGHP
jgi:hypothetical protein